MSLNFFKTNPKKTDASIDYKSILGDLSLMDSSANALNIDQFVQQQDISLGQHQEFYKEEKRETEIPKRLQEDTQYSVQDTRTLVNSFIELSNTMPDIKSEASECNETVESSLVKNKQTIKDIAASNLAVK